MPGARVGSVMQEAVPGGNSRCSRQRSPNGRRPSALSNKFDPVEFDLRLRGCRIGDTLEMREIPLGDEEVLGRAFFDREIDHQITELFENADAHRAVESAVVFEAPYAGSQQPVGAVKQHLAVARALSSDTALGRPPFKHLPAINRQPATPQTSLDRAGPSGKSIARPPPTLRHCRAGRESDPHQPRRARNQVLKNTPRRPYRLRNSA